jgi:hypothetical protein
MPEHHPHMRALAFSTALMVAVVCGVCVASAAAIGRPARMAGARAMLGRADAVLHRDQAAFLDPALAGQLVAGLNAARSASGPYTPGNPLLTTAVAPSPMGISDEWLADSVCRPYAPPPLSPPGTYRPRSCGRRHEQAAFKVFKSTRRLRYARMFLPYDTIYGYDPRTHSCRLADPVTYGPGGARIYWWQALGDFLTAAHRAGLTPTLALAKGATDTGGDAEEPNGVPNMNDPVQVDRYVCGAEGIMLWTSRVGYPVPQWEAFNEPDVPQNEALSGAPGNAQNAATMLIDMELASTELGRAGDRFAAGAFHFYRPDFDGDYEADLAAAGVYPAIWSIHDYVDPQHSLRCSGTGTDGCSTAMISAYVDDVNGAYGAIGRAAPHYWITETGVQLQPRRSRGPLYDSKRPAQLQKQANAAADVNTRADDSAQITELFQYTIQSEPDEPGRPGFDSALVDSDGTNPPDGIDSYGGRSLSTPSFCVIALDLPPTDLGHDAPCDDPAGSQK